MLGPHGSHVVVQADQHLLMRHDSIPVECLEHIEFRLAAARAAHRDAERGGQTNRCCDRLQRYHCSETLHELCIGTFGSDSTLMLEDFQAH